MAEIVRCSVSTMRAPEGSRTSARRSARSTGSTPPAVGASHGVGADAAEADAAVATSTAAGADAATAPFSGSAGSTEVVCGSFAVEGPRSEGQTQK